MRSYKPLEKPDLYRLLELARVDRMAFFRNRPDWAIYSGRVLGTALCQGAALHYMRPDHGINDFDVYTFYAAHPDRKWYAKRIKSMDFGDPKFGQSEVTQKGFIGRRVDLMGRALAVEPGTPFIPAILSYLSEGRSKSAQELAKKAVVVLEPENEFGTVIWPDL